MPGDKKWSLKLIKNFLFLNCTILKIKTNTSRFYIKMHHISMLNDTAFLFWRQ